MSLRKEDLELKITEKHIMLDDNVTWTNEKLVKALGDYTLSHSKKEKYCWGARYLQSLETVMLCKHLKDEKKALDKAGIDPMTSDDYVSEFKLNGSRVAVYYDPWVGFKLFSRRESVDTFLYNDFTDRVLLITDNGVFTKPQDYIGKFNYRFILDGEITVDSENAEYEGVAYADIEDLMQAMLGSLPERAHRFQKEGNRFILNSFDCIYFEKDPVQEPPVPKFDYLASDRDLSKSEIKWVENMFADYLRTAGFKGYTSAKKLYRYLFSLSTSLKNDLRRLPFKRRREIRHLLTDFLSGKGLPFREVEGEDTDKSSYLDDVLGNRCEGIILKNVHAPYISTLKSSRSHRAAMKVKQSITQILSSDNVDSDFDVFITGINPPKSKTIKDMIGSLNCSIYINEPDGTVTEHVIASVSGIPHDWKRELCAFDQDGNMVLNPDYYGKVIAINGLALTYKLKFQHAVLYNKSDLVFKDKDPVSCVWDREALEKMVITRGY